MPNHNRVLTRRTVLALAAAAGSAFGEARADDQAGARKDIAGSAGNRTLVCLYLTGGSDGNSLVAPLEPSQFEAYSAARGALGLRADALLPVRDRATGIGYGLDARLAELQKYFQDGSAAVLANLGEPVRPTVRSRYDSLRFVTGACATSEWAARAAGSSVENDQVFTFPQGVTLLPLGGASFSGTRKMNPELIEAFGAATFRTRFPETLTGKMIRTVAGLLKSGNVAGSSSGQVIYFPMNGFGPSSLQTMAQAPAFRELSTVIAALHEATLELGVADRVTIYTDSEWGRTLRPGDRATAGAGWGNHHFVVGGAVRGGTIYGAYPDMKRGPFDNDSALIPTTSRAQYESALAAWVGIPASALPRVVPGFDGKPMPGFLPA